MTRYGAPAAASSFAPTRTLPMPWTLPSLRARRRARPEEKTSRVARLIALDNPGRAVWTPRDYASLAREGYARNPVVFRCVRLIAEQVANVPLLVREGRTELDEHPMLALLNRPNPRQPGPAFLEAVTSHLLLAGNAYVEAVTLDGRIVELYALRPDRMRVVAGPEGWPAAYDYTVGNQSVRFTQDGAVPPILHIALFHPVNDHYGLAPLEAAQVSLDVLNAAANWNKALLDNSARPSGALVYAPPTGGTLSREQFDRLKEELELSFQGAGNAGRPLLLEGGLDWKQLSLTPRDLDFVEAKNAAAREVALAFGVPPQLLGIKGDATYANYQEANKAFWRQTVLPLLGRLCRTFEHWLSPALGDVTLWYDADAIDALSADREALWARIGAAPFLTEDEKREAVGYGRRGAAGDEAAADEQVELTGLEAGEAKYNWNHYPARATLDGEKVGGRFAPKEGVQVASRFRGPNTVNIRGVPIEATSEEALRFELALGRSIDAVRQVRELDPTWNPSQSFTSGNTIRGAIETLEARTREAETRLMELARARLGHNQGPPLGEEPDWVALRDSLLDPLGRQQHGDPPLGMPAPPADIEWRRAKARLNDYRTHYGMIDLGDRAAVAKPEGTAAITYLDRAPIFGINSSSLAYTNSDRDRANNLLGVLVRQNPDIFWEDRISWIPNIAVYHAETTVLLRAAAASGGSLEGRDLTVYVDRVLCRDCEKVLPYVGLQLGNPTVRFIDPYGIIKEMRDGRIYKLERR